MPLLVLSSVQVYPGFLALRFDLVSDEVKGADIGQFADITFQWTQVKHQSRFDHVYSTSQENLEELSSRSESSRNQLEDLESQTSVRL